MNRPYLWCRMLIVGVATMLSVTARAEEPSASPVVSNLVTLIEQGAFEAALSQTEEALALSPENLELLLLKGSALRGLRQHESAIEVYDRVVTLDPQNQLARNLQALLLMEQARTTETNDAPTLILRALNVSDNAPGILTDAIGELARRKCHKDVVRLYETAPGDVAGLDGIVKTAAAAYQELEQFDNAAELYRTVLQDRPSDPSAASGLVRALFAAGHLDEAMKATSAALAYRPASLDLLLTRAAIERQAGQVPAACKTLDRVLAVNPSDKHTRNLKARLLADMGCYSLAGAWIEENPSVIEADVRQDVDAGLAAMRATWEGEQQETGGVGRFTAIRYRNVAVETTGESDALDLASFVLQVEWLRAKGVTFLGGRAILQAARDQQALPDGSVALVFEGPYQTFTTAVLPMLELYDCPAVLAVCSSWIESGAPDNVTSPLMSWNEIREVARHRLVTIASLSHALNGLVPAHPDGRTGVAATTRLYDPATGRYETPAAYRERLARDLRQATDYVCVRTSTTPYLLLWPFGARNRIAAEEARGAGLMTLDDLQDRREPRRHAQDKNWWLVESKLSPESFARAYREHSGPPEPSRVRSRGLRVSVDMFIPEEDANTGNAVDLFISRAIAMGVDTVYLDAFADANGNGSADEFYFPNSLLPVKQDILAGIAERIRAAGLELHICMPVLAFELTGMGEQEKLLVMESKFGKVRPTKDWQDRLSPFNETAQSRIEELYADLAGHVPLDGVVFLEDAFLTDAEDFNPSATRHLRDMGTTEINPRLFTETQKKRWMEIKTEQLERFIAGLAASVRDYRPNAVFSRVLYAPVVHHPESESWLSQNFGKSLAAHDHVIVLADPEAEEVEDVEAWLVKLASEALEFPDAALKTSFFLRTRDRARDRWFSERELTRRSRSLIEGGAGHLIYGPDDFRADKPKLRTMKVCLQETGS